jgi:hypothetical protein
MHLLRFVPVVVAACGSGGLVLDAALPDAAPERPDYELVFDSSRIVDVHIALSAASWAALEAEPREYVSGSLRWDGELHDNVGIKHKGNVSLDFAGAKKSWKLDFNRYDADHRFHGLKALELHNGFKDPTLMRENLAYAVHRAAGDVGSRTSHVRVFLTVPGLHDDVYWGLYVNVEPVNKAYVRDRFTDDEGTLYEGGDFRWYGADPTVYVPGVYEPETNESSTDHAALLRFLDVLNNTPIAELGPALEQVFDVERFLGWLAANTALANMDGIPGGGGNCHVYHDPAQDKIVVIPWDMNEAFGSTSEGLTVDELLALDVHAPVVAPGAQPLIERVLQVPSFVERYDAKLRALIVGELSEAAVTASIDTIYGQIRDAVHADTNRHYDIPQFELSITDDVIGLPDPPYPPTNRVIGLKRFVRARVSSIADQLP